MNRERFVWMTHADCVERPDLPWTSDTDALTRTAVREMRRVCAGCPVRGACLQAVTELHITAGWWGGVDQTTYPLESDFTQLGDAA